MSFVLDSGTHLSMVVQCERLPTRHSCQINFLFLFVFFFSHFVDCRCGWLHRPATWTVCIYKLKGLQNAVELSWTASTHALDRKHLVAVIVLDFLPGLPPAEL